MSYCRQEGANNKDQVIVLTEDDLKAPITSEPVLELSKKDNDDGYEGAITDSGDINWSCPCMAGMVSGPCGFEFREAFSCFHYSSADPKGAEEGDDSGAFGDGSQDTADEYATRGRSESVSDRDSAASRPHIDTEEKGS